MALIICPECGRQISEKAAFCPHCGLPSSEFFNEVENETDIFIEEVKRIHRIYPIEKVKAVKALRDYSGFGLKEAMEIMDKEYAGADYSDLVALYKTKADKWDKKKEMREEKKNEKKEKKHSFLEFCNEVAVNSQTPHCPKCYSTSISYQDKISYGRAAAGGLLAGPAGAVLGGLTGKKGYAVCLNCGKRWKV